MYNLPIDFYICFDYNKAIKKNKGTQERKIKQYESRNKKAHLQTYLVCQLIYYFRADRIMRAGKNHDESIYYLYANYVSH